MVRSLRTLWLLGVVGLSWGGLPVTRGNLAWQQALGYRSAPLTISSTGQPGFRLMPAAETGVTFSNRLSDAVVANNRLLEIGSGVALGDVDGDGWVDIYFCRLEGDNVLYRNQGRWRFEDVTAQAGVACSGQYSTGCALVDVNGDGPLDLLVNSLGGGTRVFLNNGKGRFTEKLDSGLFRQLGATSLALADVKGDGTLDLYVTNYRTDTFFDNPPGLRIELRQQPDGRTTVEPKERFVTRPGADGAPIVVERGEPDVLYINRGGGRFAPIPWQTGVFVDDQEGRLTTPPTDWGLSVLFRDLNQDGQPDLYVCNDFVSWPDRVWLNESGRRFRAAPAMALRCTSLSSMAVDVADINRDGFDDLFVADMLSPGREARAWQRPDMPNGADQWRRHDPQFRPEVPRNTLQLARGDGTFAEIASLAGVAATYWTTSAAFLDVDLDGWEDLLLGTGSNHDVQDLDALSRLSRAAARKTAQTRLTEWRTIPPRPEPGVALLNRRDLTFEDRSASWGFDVVGVAHGMALADLDQDGDLDVVLNSLNAPARLFRNETRAPRLAVRLAGAGANTRGIGGRIQVVGGPVTQSQEMLAGGRFCSSDDPMRVFACGNATLLRIEVLWRSGKRSLVERALPNHAYIIEESGASASEATSVSARPSNPSPIFEDASARLNHVHVDIPGDDFRHQPLLPRRLSSLGPGLCWTDLDGNGVDSLVVGAGKGGRTAILRNDGQGQFREATESRVPQLAERDQTTLLGWRGADLKLRMLMAESNWEDAETNAPGCREFLLDGGVTSVAFPSRPGPAAPGPMALADVDNDGDLDLFVGGRVVARRYPEAAGSVLLLNNGHEEFTLSQTWNGLGLVSGAVFFDYNADGWADLALASEWDSIRIFENERGRLHEVTGKLGLASTQGWWNGLAAGDFDGDGRMDLVASNWGRNWRTDQPFGRSNSVHLVYGDFTGEGTLHSLLASDDPSLGKLTPWRERTALLVALPDLGRRFSTYHAYGAASVAELLGPAWSQARTLEAAWFDSTVFLNREGRFEAHPLPIEAQFAPAFGVSVGDFDGDAKEDVFLAQNFFGVDAEQSRQDAGVGLLLLGDGRGQFRPLSPRQSGIAIFGEQRGSALSDFDRDGRLDLAVAQNNGPTKLYRNLRAKPGVRVGLRGVMGNPQGVGSTVRLRCAGQWGPGRQVHVGSGYWSQDSTRLLLAAPSQPEELEVRWPGGKVTRCAWPAGRTAVDVDPEGIKGP